MTDNVIEIESLSRRFGQTQALDQVNLSVPKGCVFGLVGENGAGKTTLLKHVLGLYRAQQGTVRVFGCVPADQPVEVLSRIGYLSEDRALPDWRIHELLSYTAAFYQWDSAYAKELCDTFELDVEQRVKGLSRGQRARVGLVLALSHRPPLLVLDEPSSGLDPVVRRDILGAIIRTVADEGRTVLFSSHLLDEVQRVADQIAIIRNGRILITDSLDGILNAHEQLTIRFPSPLTESPTLPGAVSVSGDGKEWTVLCNGNRAGIEQQIAIMGAEIVERSQPSLEEVFVARVNQ